MSKIRDGQAALDRLMVKDSILPSEQDTPREVTRNGNDPGAYDDVLAVGVRYADKSETPVNGDRNRAAFSLAGQLFALTHKQTGETLTEDDVLGLVQRWNARNPDPLPEREIDSTVRSAATNGTPRPPKLVGHDLGRRASVENRQVDNPEAVAGPVNFASLRRDHPKLHEPVIEGLLRRGETVNIIASPKVGKSWLAYDLALSIISGKWWLTEFQCHAGPVLLIDNELHPPTIAHRVPKVAEARGLEASEYADRLDVLSLRGQGMTLDRLQAHVDRIKAGYYSAIIADAWYRFIPQGMNENANADVMNLYNTLDRYAGQTEAAWIVIHHASKGSQSDKAVTDVGAGAGAQSRAADTHLVLRPHEEPGCIVLEAAVRSFAPVDPIGLRWEFPVWNRAHDLDTQALKGRKSQSEEKQDKRDAEGLDAITKALQSGPLTARAIRNHTGLSRDRAERLIGKLYADGQLTAKDVEVRGNKTREYQLAKGVVGEQSTTYPTT
ncbi:MAG: AAA family ATPase [Phycisphaeraceae bacterium]